MVIIHRSSLQIIVAGEPTANTLASQEHANTSQSQ